MGEGAEELREIEERRSLDRVLHQQGRCEYPCPYCAEEDEVTNRRIKA